MKLLQFSVIALGLMAAAKSDASASAPTTAGAGADTSANPPATTGTGNGGDDKEDKKETPKPPKGKKIKVRCLIHSLGEGDEVYTKGQTFDTTEDRAKALGNSVEAV